MPKKIIISGEIGWDVFPGDIRKQLSDAGNEDKEIEISSPGGFVSYGLEIFNLIRNASGFKNTRIIGQASSMGSYIALAGDKVSAEDNVYFMIHNVSGGTWGDYREMEKYAEILDGLTGLLAKKYSEKSGKPEKEIRQMMNDETWLFGEEMLTAGFVDEIITTDKPKDKAGLLAQARARHSLCMDKIKKLETADDRNAAAAMIRAATTTAHNPAPNAGKNTMEVQVMPTLQELLSQNPAAKAEYDAAMQAKFEAGKIEGESTVTARVTKAAPFVGNKEYPAKVTELAIAAIKGEKSIDALETTVSTLDAIREQSASTAAAAESEATAGIHAEQEPEHSTDGVIRNEADLMAEINAKKIRSGQEVK